MGNYTFTNKIAERIHKMKMKLRKKPLICIILLKIKVMKNILWK